MYIYIVLICRYEYVCIQRVHMCTASVLYVNSAVLSVSMYPSNTSEDCHAIN